MLNATELKIGNFIRKIDGHGYIQVDAEILCCLANSKPEQMEEEYIPLTEEWLLRFNCRQTTSMKSHWSCGEIDFIFDSEFSRVLVSIGNRMRFINYVHDFQNYFALLGIEFTFR